MDNGNRSETAKKWQKVVSCYFSGPAMAILGCFMLGWIWIALLLLLVFSTLLYTSGIRRVFNLLPSVTRFLIVSAPVVFTISWLAGVTNIGQSPKVALAVSYAALLFFSNLSIPPYLESHDGNAAER
jgi:hypothetical protein